MEISIYATKHFSFNAQIKRKEF